MIGAVKTVGACNSLATRSAGGVRRRDQKTAGDGTHNYQLSAGFSQQAVAKQERSADLVTERRQKQMKTKREEAKVRGRLKEMKDEMTESGRMEMNVEKTGIMRRRIEQTEKEGCEGKRS